jgi:hypothetical protein
MTAKMTYADLRLETFTLYDPLDEGIQTISPQGDGNLITCNVSSFGAW